MIIPRQPVMGDGRLDFHLGFNILKNGVLLLFDAVAPFSAPRLFEAVVHREIPVLAGAALASALFPAVVLYGLLRTGRKNLAVFMFFLAGICSFPVILMNHISELYLCNMLPAISVLVGIGAGSAWKAVRPLWIRGTVTLFLAVFFISNIAAIQSRAALMQDNGERAAHLMDRLSVYIRNAPRDGRVILLNPLESHLEYSIYYLSGFSVLKFSISRIKQMYGRKDITFKIIDAPALPPEETGRNPLVLRLRGGNIDTLSPRIAPEINE